MNRDSVKAFMAKELNIPVSKLADDSVNLTDLVHESFILIELVIALQEEFKVRLVQEDLQEVKSLGQLIDVLQKKKLS
ncbi:MAG: acyl carrier protein [Bacteriovoracaceae bacterium]